MTEEKVMNRWWVVLGAIIIQLCLGVLYAWSAFTASLTASPWDLPGIYGAPAFSMTTEQRTALIEELKIPKAELKKLTDAAKLLNEGSAEREQADVSVAAQKAALTGVLEARIDPARIRQLTFGLNKAQTQWIFSVGLAVFAIVMALVAGNWQKKAGPKVVALTGGLVLGLGYVVAGFSGNSFLGMLIGIGILGGAGIGLGYVCPIAALVKWFPDKKGFITGLAVAGFGFGALIWIKMTSGFKFGPLDLTPGWTGLYGMGWSVGKVFIAYGIAMAALVGIGAMFLTNPPVGWKPTGWTAPSGTAASSSGGNDFTVSQMIRTPQYWTLFVTFVVGALAGLMVIGVIQLFGKDALTTRAGLTPEKANIIAGTAMGLFYSLLNGFGRIAWGSLSDKLGRKYSIVLMSALQGLVMIAFYIVGGVEWGLYITAGLIGFNFGGNFALFPAATADYFGNKNVGTNYPWVFLSYGVGGIVGPILGGMMGDAMAWKWAFIPAGIACLVVAALSMTLKPPMAAEARKV